MIHLRFPLFLAFLCAGLHAAPPSLTIYNQDFAVVRERIPLELKKGVNDIVFDGATLHLEPDSVILRDTGGAPLSILEQNYRNDPLSQHLLLSLSEGKEIDFLVREQQKPDRMVRGKVIRSGHVSEGNPGASDQPVIEVDGKIQFSLPGEPLFPSLGDDTILKPCLDWKISSPKDFKSEAELGYVTGGMSWQASYNLVAPEHGDELDLVGWITMENRSGRDFSDARIRLMAGDVNRVSQPRAMANGAVSRMMKAVDELQPAVTEKAFDEYHLYTLERNTTLKDHETKQVEFLHATGIKAETIYLYDGGAVDWNRWGGALPGRRILEEEFGAEGGKKILVVREFRNSKENGLGIPFPKGRMRLYRSNGSQLEFTGEDEIDHTPSDELVRITTGKAFDLVGERKRTNFAVNQAERWAAESFEILLRNRKKEPVEIRVVEHLLRWVNWEISENSDPFAKTNAQQVEFRVKLKPGEEKKLTYKVRYSW
jgi:hypothetical protein